MILRIPSSLLYRRRPPRPSLSLITQSCLILISLLSTLARAQDNTQTTVLTIPSTTTFNLSTSTSTFFSLPSSASSLAISLSICSPPSSVASDPSHFLSEELNRALYLSTSSDLIDPGPENPPDSDKGDSSQLRYGWANVTLDSAPDGAWIGVHAPGPADVTGDDHDDDLTLEGTWEFELVISQGATADWLAQGTVGLKFEDSDATGVLLSTGNYTANGETGIAPPTWRPLVAEADHLTYPLSRSRCYVRRMQAAAQAETGRNVTQSETSRGYGGGTKSQFDARGLEGGKNYTAWLTQNSTADSGNETRIWDPVFFSTKSSSSCRLIYDLDFCPQVAYSVPSPPSLPTSDLVSYFNSSIQPSLVTFARTLTTFPCDVPEMGRYSVVSTCSDCYAAYRDWVCATTIPRCADAPSDSSMNDTTSALSKSGELAAWTIPDHAFSLLVRNDPHASRTPAFGPLNLSTTFPSLFNDTYPSSPSNLLAESPFPYSEVPPCTDVCSLVEARCPPFLSWFCPSMESKGGQTGLAGYGRTEGVDSQDRMAGDLELGTSRMERAADRWGNVFCNALSTDLTSAAQFITQTTSISAASPPVLSTFSCVSVAILVAFAFF
ncbi:hypothetical protein JCM11641_001990 [Rhodosporidiobolus odoratus]